jgi:hypothetical protein
MWSQGTLMRLSQKEAALAAEDYGKPERAFALNHLRPEPTSVAPAISGAASHQASRSRRRERKEADYQKQNKLFLQDMSDEKDQV